MSTRSVKFSNNNNNNSSKQNNHRSNNKNNNYHGNQHKSIIPKNNYTIQQPKKKLQVNESPRQKRRHQKKSYQFEEENDQEENHDDSVYAGPTFSNAPAPSALPIPAFNARGSPINYQKQSMDLMNLLSPQKVVTAYELEKTNLALSEIQKGLRSMLKIES